MRGRRALAVSCGLGLLLAVPADARAADELGLSRDGRTWSDRIETPLFDRSVRWVPGDERTATFYVRNQGPGRARLAVDLRAGGDPVWVATDGLEVGATVGGRAAATADVGSGWRLATARAVPSGEVLAVAVTVALPAAATDVTQERTVRADLRVTLAEDVPGVDGGSGAGGVDGGSEAPGGGTGSGDGGVSGQDPGADPGAERPDASAPPSTGEPAWLPGTGGPAGWALLVAGLLLGAGSALLRHPRARDDRRDPRQQLGQQEGT